MNRFLKGITAFVVILGIVLGIVYYILFTKGDKQPLAELLPADTLAYFDITHLRHYSLKLARNDLSEPAVELFKVLGIVFSAAFAEQLEVEPEALPKEKPAVDSRDFLNLAVHFNRQLSIALLSGQPIDVEKTRIPDLVVLAHFVGKTESFDRDILDLTRKLNEGIEEPSQRIHWTVDNWNGQPLRVLNIPSLSEKQGQPEDTFELPEIRPSWTVIGSKFYAAINPETLKTLIEGSQTQPIENSLAANPLFQEIDLYQSKRDLGVYLATGQFLPTVINALDKAIHSDGPNMLGISFKRIISDTGILSADSIALSVNQDPKKELITSSIHISDKQGIWKLVEMNHDAYPFPEAAPIGIASTGIYSLDLGELTLWVKDIVLKNVPIAAMFYSPQKRQLDEAYGTDLEEFLKNAFSEQLMVYTDYSTTALPSENGTTIIPTQSIALSLQIADREEFEPVFSQFLKAKSESPTPYETITVAGYSFYQMPSAFESRPTVRFGIADDRLLVAYGDIALLRSILQSRAPGAFQNEAVQATFATLPEGEGSVQLIDLKNPLETLVTVLQHELIAASEYNTLAEEAYQSIDWEALKLLHIKLASKAYETENGFYNQLKRVAE